MNGNERNARNSGATHIAADMMMLVRKVQPDNGILPVTIIQTAPRTIQW